MHAWYMIYTGWVCISSSLLGLHLYHHFCSRTPEKVPHHASIYAQMPSTQHSADLHCSARAGHPCIPLAHVKKSPWSKAVGKHPSIIFTTFHCSACLIDITYQLSVSTLEHWTSWTCSQESRAKACQAESSRTPKAAKDHAQLATYCTFEARSFQHVFVTWLIFFGMLKCST